MAGHSHWAGIKHKKGRVDKQRSKIFSKLSKEIIVAAKLGSKDPDTNPRLRSAIQAARTVNMPKDNIERAISKSEVNKNLNYNSLVYEGFGPEKIAIMIEALTDNKNRTIFPNAISRNQFDAIGNHWQIHPRCHLRDHFVTTVGSCRHYRAHPNGQGRKRFQPLGESRTRHREAGQTDPGDLGR